MLNAVVHSWKVQLLWKSWLLDQLFSQRVKRGYMPSRFTPSLTLPRASVARWMSCPTVTFYWGFVKIVFRCVQVYLLRSHNCDRLKCNLQVNHWLVLTFWATVIMGPSLLLGELCNSAQIVWTTMNVPQLHKTWTKSIAQLCSLVLNFVNFIYQSPFLSPLFWMI